MSLSAPTATTAPPQRESVATKQAAFADSLGEPEYAAIRRQLGFRPSAYADEGVDVHPDRRPCPSWCWVGRSGGEYDHEVDWTHPMEAEHHHDDRPTVVASLYGGEHVSCGTEGPGYVRAATIEPHLEQLGQRDPIIRVLRHWEGRESKYGEILMLSLTDAQELATALTYLIDTAES